MGVQSQSFVEAWLAAAGLVVALVFGAWWTGMAVMNGDVGWTLARFVISVGVGLYYAILLRVARSPHRDDL